MLDHLLRDLKEGFLDILYPPDVNCILCHSEEKILPGYNLCRSCMDKLPFIKPPLCSVCGKPMSFGGLCPDCGKGYREFILARSVLEYEGIVRKMIYRYKYGGEQYFAVPFGRFLWDSLQQWQDDWAVEVLIPVPLHANRWKMRGFNQAELLCRELEKHSGIPLATDVLIRSKDTHTQAGLTRSERMANLSWAFEVKDSTRVQGKTVLLVDDIFTTGTTADQCSRALKEAGADRVYILTLATGRNI